MRQIALLVLCVFTFCCNTKQSDKKSIVIPVNNTCTAYPKIVDSLKLRDLYDSAKWYVYTWHCNDVYLPKSDTSKRYTYGEMELIFDELHFKHDTVEINFHFFDGKGIILPSMSRNYKELSTGTAFALKARKKIYMISPNGFSSTIQGGVNRFETPLTPEVALYIENTWDKLNHCFRKLAEQKGVKK